MADEENEVEESTRPVKVKDEAQFDELIADPGRLVVVAFVAPWCGACKAFGPQLEETAQLPDFERVQFLSVNTDAMPNVAKKFGLNSLPTFKYLLKGEELLPGFSGSNLDKFKKILESAFAKRNEVMAEYDAAKNAEAEGGDPVAEED
mmetsp:Transcript_32995/g.59100  ORF Transcript_32995/g.59100 Transcript_32995/m.59100 type:complete len:148 (-) Transcript_32995:188-631(-)